MGGVRGGRVAAAPRGGARHLPFGLQLHAAAHPHARARGRGGGAGGARTKRHALVFWVGRHADRFRFLAWKYQHAQIIRGRAPSLRELLCEQGREPPEFFALFRKPDGGGAAAAGAASSPLVFLQRGSAAEGAVLAATSREELEGMFDVGGHAGWRACAVQVARRPSDLLSPAIVSLISCHLISYLLPSHLLSRAISSLTSAMAPCRWRGARRRSTRSARS